MSKKNIYIERDMHDGTWYVVEELRNGEVVEHREVCDYYEARALAAKLAEVA